MELTNASGVGTLTVSGLFSNEVVTLEFDEEIRQLPLLNSHPNTHTEVFGGFESPPTTAHME